MTIKITAGKFYRVREGRIVGPAQRNTTGRNELTNPWLVGGLTYREDGMYYPPFGTDFDIIEEVSVQEAIPVKMTRDNPGIFALTDTGIVRVDGPEKT